ncbi:MAG: sensor histidine kinase N-terminal domain-containing protein [Comamonas sp.]
MTTTLRNRLLVLLVLPVCVLAVAGSWWGYRSAETAAGQHDQRLLRLLPQLADSVMAPAIGKDMEPLMALSPSIDDFVRNRSGITGYAVADLDGHVLAGDPWISVVVPTTPAAEFHSQEFGGITYRVAVQRAMTAGAGEMVVALADGSDVRQQWRHQLLTHVLLPNMLLVVVAAWLIYWSVRKAFKPLLDLAQAVESRSPRDLSPIDETTSPKEVRPLVQSLNRLFGLVQAQSETQRRFVADAAHQLRTPLAALQAQVEAWALMAAQVERLGPPSAPAFAPAAPDQPQSGLFLQTEQIEKLRNATRRTSQLAHQLLALSRADARHVQSQAHERVDLKELCENLLEAFWDSAAAKQIDLGLEVEAVHTSGQAWLLRELLSNLVDNAIKYTPSGGQVTLRCGRRRLGGRQPQAFLQVEDDGPGVPLGETERILERFYRLPGSVGEGSGLGLAIAHEIAQGHHATLRLMPGAGQRGLQVTLVFPE